MTDTTEVWGNGCECWVTPESMWTRHYSAVEPGSQVEFNPACPKHGTRIDPGERVPDREEHNAVQGQWVGGEPGNAAPMPATTTATPETAPLTGPNNDPAAWGDCVWCGHPTDVHYDGGCNISAHTDQPQCGCSHDPDWLDTPEPPRGDE